MFSSLSYLFLTFLIISPILNQAVPCSTRTTKTTTSRPITSTPSRPTTTVTYADSLLGGSCKSGSECAGLVGNAVCLNGICRCRTGYVAQGKMRCIPAKSK